MILKNSFYALFFSLVLTSCATSNLLFTHPLNDAPLQGGTYDVILYGLETPHDVRTVAILDRTDDAYQIVSATKYNYRIQTSLSQEEAVSQAVRFLQGSLLINRIEKREIAGPNGEVLGYEFRPIFYPFLADNSRYDCVYTLQDGKTVSFYVYWHGFQSMFEGRDRGEN